MLWKTIGLLVLTSSTVRYPGYIVQFISAREKGEGGRGRLWGREGRRVRRRGRGKERERGERREEKEGEGRKEREWKGERKRERVKWERKREIGRRGELAE